MKICIFFWKKIFDLIFIGYDLLVWKWVDGTQTGSIHLIFICRQKNADSGPMYPKNLARREGHWKSLKNGLKSQFLAKNPVLRVLYGENNYKLCLGWVSGRSGTKSINKKKNSDFTLKIHDFSKKNFGKPKIRFFGPRNPVGWASHVVLALNQWIRPKNGEVKKVYRKCGKM